MLRTDISLQSDVVNLSRSCLPLPFRFYYLIRKEISRGRDLDLEVRQSSRELPVGLHNIELFALSTAKGGLLYAAELAFWHNLESPRCFVMSTALCSFRF